MQIKLLVLISSLFAKLFCTRMVILWTFQVLYTDEHGYPLFIHHNSCRCSGCFAIAAKTESPGARWNYNWLTLSLLVWYCYKSLSVLFNRSFADRHFPTAWKEALVVPMYKKGNRSQLTKNRPIALLSAVGKVCEQLVQVQLQKLLSTYLSDNQSGFRKGDSTSHQLFRLVQTWSDVFDSRKLVGVVLFDLAKAFDKVWHRGLLANLEAAGLRGGALDWITSYLSNRTQQTRVGNCVSDPAQIKYSLDWFPMQGAIWSPLLLTVYVNDIFKCSSSSRSVNLFADDTSSFIIDRSQKRLAIRLQAKVENLSAWFSEWLLSVKSAVLILSSRSNHPEQLSNRRLSDTTSSPPQTVSVLPSRNPCPGQHTLMQSALKQHSALASFIATILDYRRLSFSVCTQLVFDQRWSMPQLLGLDYHLAMQNTVPWAHSASCSPGRLIVGEQPRSTTPHDLLLCLAGLPTQSLSSRRNITLCLLAYGFVHHRLPPGPHCVNAFQAWCPTKSARSTSLRPHINNLIRLPKANTSVRQRSPLYAAIQLWTGTRFPTIFGLSLHVSHFTLPWNLILDSNTFYWF